ncbi:3'(2'),5'-bisphosphate nucleotidase CysQ family protein [Anthocerotibacter panamensis]|uniref:3'(2'),5'-bisphosphate nucleotidase CysQ family protein n=1 Tax=Anthocerotibacter panamensis TaxID=2857077 RepID=UPI001C40698D|nr:3'(2'),5'-bisphosphate nucleotidase CysQ [Anthocerotibacter panamensis]
MFKQSLPHLIDLIRPIAWHASDILMDFYNRAASQGNSTLKTTEKALDDPVTAADLAVSDYLAQALPEAMGTEEFFYLTEETINTVTYTERQSKPGTWLVDPLDGTKDFLLRTGDFAIHIGLVVAGRPVLGVVQWPVHEQFIWAYTGGGAFTEGRDGVAQPLHCNRTRSLAELSLVGSRTHRNRRLEALVQKMPYGAEQQMGSLGLKLAAIARAEVDYYLGLSGKSAPKDWDFAAPEVILTEAGGQMTFMNGDPLVYNKPDVSHFGLVIASNGIYHEALCRLAEAAMAQIGDE